MRKNIYKPWWKLQNDLQLSEDMMHSKLESLPAKIIKGKIRLSMKDMWDISVYIVIFLRGFSSFNYNFWSWRSINMNNIFVYVSSRIMGVYHHQVWIKFSTFGTLFYTMMHLKDGKLSKSVRICKYSSTLSKLSLGNRTYKGSKFIEHSIYRW